jgi:hypothetical protein
VLIYIKQTVAAAIQIIPIASWSFFRIPVHLYLVAHEEFICRRTLGSGGNLVNRLVTLFSPLQQVVGDGSANAIGRFLNSIIPAGALPFVAAASFCMAIAPLPRALRRASKKAEIEEEGEKKKMAR